MIICHHICFQHQHPIDQHRVQIVLHQVHTIAQNLKNTAKMKFHRQLVSSFLALYNFVNLLLNAQAHGYTMVTVHLASRLLGIMAQR